MQELQVRHGHRAVDLEKADDNATADAKAAKSPNRMPTAAKDSLLTLVQKAIILKEMEPDERADALKAMSPIVRLQALREMTRLKETTTTIETGKMVIETPLQAVKAVKHALHGPIDEPDDAIMADVKSNALGSMPVTNSVTGKVPPVGLQGLPVGGLHVAGLHKVPLDAAVVENYGNRDGSMTARASPVKPPPAIGLEILGVIEILPEDNNTMTSREATLYSVDSNSENEQELETALDSEPEEAHSAVLTQHTDITGGVHGSFSPRSKASVNPDAKKIKGRYHAVKQLWSHLKDTHIG